MKNGIAYIALTALLFSTLEPASKLMAGQLHPLALTALRFLMGGAVLMPLSLKALRRMPLRPTKATFAKMGALGVLCVGVSMGLLQIAVFQAQSAALIAIIFSSNAVFTIVLGTLLLGERITARKLLALTLCLTGILLGANAMRGESWQAVALAVVAALAFSLYTVCSKRLMSDCPGVVLNGFSFVIGALVLAALLPVAGAWQPPSLQTNSIWILLYLGVVVTGLGYWSFFAAIERSGAFSASLVFFIKPVLAPFVTMLILGSGQTGSLVFLSLALVLAGSVLATLDNRK